MQHAVEFALLAARWAGPAFLAALSLILLMRLAWGQIDMGRLDLAHAQLLLATLGAAGVYAYALIRLKQGAALPAPSPMVLALLGGSHLTHLGRNLANQWSAQTAGGT